MKTVYCTYYDNIERAGFYPELIVENWEHCDDRVITCSPDSYNVLNNMKTNAQIIDIGMSVRVPSDIPKCLNTTVDTLFFMGYDNVVLIYGDIYLTKKGDSVIYNAIHSTEEPYYSLPVMGVQLYANVYVHDGTVNISSKHKRIIHNPDADGEERFNQPQHFSTDLDLVLDIGYLGLKQYYTKTRNNINIWKDDGLKSFIIRSYESKNYESCVRAIYRELKIYGARKPIPIDYSVYEYLIHTLGLDSDYEFCKNILQQV